MVVRLVVFSGLIRRTCSGTLRKEGREEGRKGISCLLGALLPVSPLGIGLSIPVKGLVCRVCTAIVESVCLLFVRI